MHPPPSLSNLAVKRVSKFTPLNTRTFSGVAVKRVSKLTPLNRPPQQTPQAPHPKSKFLAAFVPQIARVVQKWLPDQEDKEDQPRLRYISQNIIDLGELNLVEAENAIRLMSNNTDKMFKGFVDVFEHPTDDMSEQVVALKNMEEEADMMMQDITEYLVQCATHDFGVKQAGNIARMIHIVAELEECTDQIYQLVKLVVLKYKKNHAFFDRVKEMADVVGQSISVFDNYLLRPIPADVMGSVHQLEEQSYTMRKSFNKEAIKRMATGDIRLEMLYTDINNHLEAIASHALNIIQESSSISQSDA